MKNIIQRLPLALFVGTTFKGLYLGFNWPEIVCLSILGVVAFLYEKYSQDKKLTELESKCGNLFKDLDALRKDLDGTKTHVQGLKLATNIRPNISVR